MIPCVVVGEQQSLFQLVYLEKSPVLGGQPQRHLGIERYRVNLRKQSHFEPLALNLCFSIHTIFNFSSSLGVM